MRRAVSWSREALDDLKEQVEYVAADNPRAAEGISQRILQTAKLLGAIATGRRGRSAGTYEKSISGLPYVLAYEIIGDPAGETISILRVIHTSRNWPPEGWPDDA
ncbi:MAG TPA: type II toxin-antitoxin system RelE/ParE family toxin [Hyphomicrobiales bacterium]|nr:type II toxin-antitoxin system RelE/ParE family toxin [Hyphomicrobiales bacterium]